MSEWCGGHIVAMWRAGRLQLDDDRIIEFTSADFAQNTGNLVLGERIWRSEEDGTIANSNPNDRSGFKKRGKLL